MSAFWIRLIQLILSLTILVVIHEFGHFLFAKLSGTRVERFYLFFNPFYLPETLLQLLAIFLLNSHLFLFLFSFYCIFMEKRTHGVQNCENRNAHVSKHAPPHSNKAESPQNQDTEFYKKGESNVLFCN